MRSIVPRLPIVGSRSLHLRLLWIRPSFSWPCSSTLSSDACHVPIHVRPRSDGSCNDVQTSAWRLRARTSASRSARTSFHRYLSHLPSQSLDTSRSHRTKVSIPAGMVSMDGCARRASSKGRRRTRRRLHACEARACSCACTSLSSPSTRAPTSRFVARSARDARFGWRKRPWRMWTDGNRS